MHLETMLPPVPANANPRPLLFHPLLEDHLTLTRAIVVQLRPVFRCAVLDLRWVTTFGNEGGRSKWLNAAKVWSIWNGESEQLRSPPIMLGCFGARITAGLPLPDPLWYVGARRECRVTLELEPLPPGVTFSLRAIVAPVTP